MIQAYCKTCEAYTPFTLDHLRTWPSSRANARDMICPHCYSIITTLMVNDEEGGYAFTYSGGVGGLTTADIGDGRALPLR